MKSINSLLSSDSSLFFSQEKEISELNDMLTEAGETFQQREMEIQKLKDLVQDYEKQLEQQVSGDLDLFDNTLPRTLDVMKYFNKHL